MNFRKARKILKRTRDDSPGPYTRGQISAALSRVFKRTSNSRRKRFRQLEAQMDKVEAEAKRLLGEI